MTEWWRGAVIYQVYPRSFQDSNGDGIGDLPGITARLPYIAELGVDALWISPFFKSPMADYGYDVEDYRAVDPMFGTLADFDTLLAEAHQLGLKVMVDMVLSHTSNRHAWFLESRSSRVNPKADWYVWADARADGTPPNNWLSVFGGSAWTWEPRRNQYYLHNFLVAQPDLNGHDPEVVAALLGEARFWLERGVDGLRLDAIDFALHDPALRDNPVRTAAGRLTGGGADGNPYRRQRHVYSKAHPALRAQLLEPLRALAVQYGQTVLLGELSGDGATERAAAYTQGDDGLHAAYTFDLLSCPLAPAAVRGVVETLEAGLGSGWPCWSLSNHDVVRAISRFVDGTPPPGLGAMLPALLGSLRGTICLYQGEELGLTEAELAFEDLRDPAGITFYPDSKGRDGCRTPIPWRRDADHGGFTEGRPWLPVVAEHRELAVDVQAADAESPLAHTRRFLAWRKRNPALVRGGLTFVDTPPPVLLFTRQLADDQILCAFNLDRAPVSARLPAEVEPLDGHGFTATLEGGTMALPGYGAFFGRVVRA